MMPCDASRIDSRSESCRFLRGRAYLGFVSAGGKEYPGVHQPLISEDLWERVQALREERTRSHGSPVRKGLAWLVGQVFCEHCGGKLWHQYGTSSGQVRYYRCSGISRRECQAPQARADSLEAQMGDILRHLVVPRELRDQIVAEAKRLRGSEPAPTPAPDDGVERKLLQLKQAYDADILTRAEYEQKCREAQRSRPRVARQLPLDVERALGLLSDIPRLLAAATPQERLALVRALFEKVWVEERTITRLSPRADVGPVLVGVVKVLDGVPDGR